MDLALTDKVAVVTGASTGFGRAIAVLFARHGARVVVGDLREEPAAGNFDEAPELTTTQLIEHGQGEALFQACDVSNQQAVAALVGAARKRFGRLDVMVNNAGVWRGGRRMHEMTEDDLDACWRVLVKGSWFGAQEAVRAFLAQNARDGGGRGGSIINSVSTAGLRGHAQQAAYNVAKAAQANLTRVLGLEYGADGIRANGICPSLAKTAMARGGFDAEGSEEMVRRVIPQGAGAKRATSLRSRCSWRRMPAATSTAPSSRSTAAKRSGRCAVREPRRPACRSRRQSYQRRNIIIPV